MIQSIAIFCCALIYANFIEWVLHKYVLHGLGKNKQSFWSFHWNEHHKACRKSGNKDESYQSVILEWNSKTKEILSLSMLSLLHLPVILISTIFFYSLVFHSCLYFYLHRKSHVNIMWGKQYLRWHYDHHMGRSQDYNWCVTFPLWDYIFGSRKIK